jgi:hypothetical protein
LFLAWLTEYLLGSIGLNQPAKKEKGRKVGTASSLLHIVRCGLIEVSASLVGNEIKFKQLFAGTLSLAENAKAGFGVPSACLS